MLLDDSTIDLVKQTLIIMMKIAFPILATGVVVGLIISIFQSVTSIQEQTLALVPKIFVMVGVAAALLPWIVSRLAEFAVTMFTLH
jgi:flagellar biosynthetic protein FliQ